VDALPLLPRHVGFGVTSFRDPAYGESREWWMGMGNGGYLSGTILHSLSRGYHGLAILATSPPVGRTLFWVKWDGWIEDGEDRIPLTSDHWRDDSWGPICLSSLFSFSLEGRLPVWCYRWKDRTLSVRIWYDRPYNACVLSCVVDSPRPVQLRIHLFFNCRDHHQIVQGDPPALTATVEGKAARLAAGGLSASMQVTSGVLWVSPETYRNFFYPRERERGLGDWENHSLGLSGSLPLLPGKEIAILFRQGSDKGEGGLLGEDFPESSRHAFLDREQALLKMARSRRPFWKNAPDWVNTLILAADTFVVDRPTSGGVAGKTVIAGYPWFGDWGRDTMISFPGLFLATGRWDEARSVLLFFSETLKDGLLPNYFPEDGSNAKYNTADASLWYLRACHLYGVATRDYATLRILFPALSSIVRAYLDGTAFGIGVDPTDGLVRIGKTEEPLTWMDARVEGKPVTPRYGKPVELSALWFNALEAMIWIAGRLREDGAMFRKEKEKTRTGFRKFLRPGGEGLQDVLEGDPEEKDAVRPNQILAVSLAGKLLSVQEARSVVVAVNNHLLTPFGLRSLSPQDPRYRGVYAGSPHNRDAAYHQGTVWAWLLGHYVMAISRLSDNRQSDLSLFEGIRDHLSEAGLGYVSEIFDGDPPHYPRGCPLQAWSVGCTIEALEMLFEEI